MTIETAGGRIKRGTLDREYRHGGFSIRCISNLLLAGLMAGLKNPNAFGALV